MGSPRVRPAPKRGGSIVSWSVINYIYALQEDASPLDIDNRYQFFGAEQDVAANTREIEGLSRQNFAYVLLFFGFVSLAAALYISSDATARDQSIQSWKLALFIQILIAVSTSIFSSMLFYLLYSRLLEKRVLRDVTANVTANAVRYAYMLFHSKFDRMLPTHVYPAANTPIPEFLQHLDNVLQDSHIYKFKGDAGGFTTFRLDRLCQNSHLLEKEVLLLILDPRENNLLRERAKIELSKSKPDFKKADLEEHIEKLRKSIYATVVAAFDIAHKARIQIAFHKEHLFFRSEIFNDGIFLTYYVGGEFPSTSYYPKHTFTYDAFLENFRQNFKTADPILSFSTTMTEDDLKSKLDLLACAYKIEDLRNFQQELFGVYDKMLESKLKMDLAAAAAGGGGDGR